MDAERMLAPPAAGLFPCSEPCEICSYKRGSKQNSALNNLQAPRRSRGPTLTAAVGRWGGSRAESGAAPALTSPQPGAAGRPGPR